MVPMNWFKSGDRKSFDLILSFLDSLLIAFCYRIDYVEPKETLKPCHSRADGNLCVSMLNLHRDRKQSISCRTRLFSEAELRDMHSQAELGNEYDCVEGLLFVQAGATR